MTKTIKITTIITSIVLAITAILSLLGLTACQKTSNTEPYILRAEVVTVGEAEYDVVECEDTEGNIWGFYVEDNQEEEWCKGDYVLLLMDTCNTATPYDDAVMGVRLDAFAY